METFIVGSNPDLILMFPQEHKYHFQAVMFVLH